MVFSKTLDKVIAVRFWKNRQNVSVITHNDGDNSVPAAIPSTLPLPALPSDLSLAYSVSAHIEQRVSTIAGPTPLAGDPLQAAINGLLTILRTINRHAQNRLAIARLRRRLHRLSGYLCIAAPSGCDGLEQLRREDLISVLQETSDQLKKLDKRFLGYQSVPQALARFSTELDNYLAEYALAAQMHIKNFVVEIETQLRQFQGSAAIDSSTVVTRHCLILVDATRWEHKIPMEFCLSFQQLHRILEVLFVRDSDEARIQTQYVKQGQYDLYIDERTQGTELTRGLDGWPKFEAGMKIIMKCLEPLCELPEDLSQLLNKTSEDAVGQGGFCDVWKCSLSYTSGITQNLKTINAAVKVLRILPDEDGMKDIRREMGIWKRLRHSHIVPFFGVADTFAPSRISLVSSWQENGTLTSLLTRNHDMEYKDRLTLLRDIASGLSYLHSVKVVHGDLTGSNVLIDTDGRARLTDFGLSSIVDAGEGLTYLALTKMRPGAVRWMAPELMKEDDIPPTFWSDIYSYGCVMLQTLSGRLPWSEIRKEYIIPVKLSQGCHPRRPESLPILDAHWDFIMLCLNPTIESRPSATEVLKWIRAEIPDQKPRNDRSYPSELFLIS